MLTVFEDYILVNAFMKNTVQAHCGTWFFCWSVIPWLCGRRSKMFGSQNTYSQFLSERYKIHIMSLCWCTSERWHSMMEKSVKSSKKIKLWGTKLRFESNWYISSSDANGEWRSRQSAALGFRNTTDNVLRSTENRKCRDISSEKVSLAIGNVKIFQKFVMEKFVTLDYDVSREGWEEINEDWTVREET